MNSRRLPALVVMAVASTAAVVIIAVSLLSDDGRMAGPPASQPREPFAFDAAYADPDPAVLVVRYGDSGTCPSLAVRHAVSQEVNRIVVTLTRSRMSTDRPCTSDYRAMLVRITLTEPLSTRQVIDASRNAPVPLSAGTPPFG